MTLPDDKTVRAFHDRVRGDVLHPGDEGDRVQAAHGENHDRLVEVKTDWDPEDLFRMNQNVEPGDQQGE